MAERKKDWFTAFLDGPRHWATFWRRAWLIMLPVSWVIWPIGMVVLMITVVMPLGCAALAALWCHAMWHGKRLDEMP